MTFKQDVEAILDKYAEHYCDQLEGFGSTHTLSKEEAASQIEALVLGLLEDEPQPYYDGNIFNAAEVAIDREEVHKRNLLRAELREELRRRVTEDE